MNERGQQLVSQAPEISKLKLEIEVLKAALELHSAQALFDRIKHGNADHVEWLAKELEDFFNEKITR